MVRAYRYLKPFVRLFVFIDSAIRECDEKIEQLRAELEMWQEPEIRDVIFSVAREGGFSPPRIVDSRIKEINDQLRLTLSKKEQWSMLLKFVGPCSACKGKGEVPGGWRDDEKMSYKDCPECLGKGRQAKVAAK